MIFWKGRKCMCCRDNNHPLKESFIPFQNCSKFIQVLPNVITVYISCKRSCQSRSQSNPKILLWKIQLCQVLGLALFQLFSLYPALSSSLFFRERETSDRNRKTHKLRKYIDANSLGLVLIWCVYTNYTMLFANLWRF